MTTSTRLKVAAVVATVALPVAAGTAVGPQLAAAWTTRTATSSAAAGSSFSVSTGGSSSSVGRRRWDPYGAQPGPSWTGSGATSTSALDTTSATADQESGLVRISTVIDYGQGEAAGTGMVLSGDGIVVTNHHVVEGATSIEVTVMSTGQTYDAELLGASARKDVAVLQLEDASGLTTIATDATGLTVGADVVAVGDANGTEEALTAAVGTVSATGRSITVADDQTGASRRLRNLVEVTSDVIPGDSGGALLDDQGEVVGMNVAASSGQTSAQVDGYVIPIARVLRVEQAVLSGRTTGDITLGYRPFLGVVLGSQGAVVEGVVAQSPASSAGLAEGDTVTAVDGRAVSTAAGLRAAIADHSVGEQVDLSWTDSSGATRTATVTLAAGPVA